MPVSKELVKLDERFKDCKFLVEATSFEQFSLWGEFNKVLKWEEDPMGFSISICKIDRRPVCICFNFCKLNGHRICFYYGSSQLVDYKAIEDYLKKNFTVKYDRTRWAHCDAMNFCHCLGAILSKKEYNKIFISNRGTK